MKMMFPEARLNRSLGGLANDMTHLVDSLLGAAGTSTGTADFSPRMDILEHDDKYLLVLDLPGVKSEDLQIELEDDNLVICGSRSGYAESEGERYHRIERVFGEFRRSVRVPRGVDREQIAAEYSDGVLSVRMPKSKAAAARRIEIRAQGRPVPPAESRESTEQAS